MKINLVTGINSRGSSSIAKEEREEEEENKQLQQKNFIKCEALCTMRKKNSKINYFEKNSSPPKAS
jgi:hypothetical protein